MSKLNETLRRFETNQNYAYAFVRIFLGVALFIRGYILVSDPGAIYVLDGEAKMHMFYSYITIIHLLGGFLMAIGLFTRVGALLQVPILFGAVFFIHAKNGLMMGGQSLELATLVFFLLLIYLFFGSGPLALNNHFNLRY
jgi:putative oxidoreductase